MPEVQVQNKFCDENFAVDEKTQKIEELRKTIEGKFKVNPLTCFYFD